MKNIIFVSSILVCLLFSMSLSGQRIVVNKVSTDINEISIQDIRSKLNTSLQPGDYPFYIDVAINIVASEKMTGLSKKFVASADLIVAVIDYNNEVSLDQKVFKLTNSGKTDRAAKKAILRAINRKVRKIDAFLQKVNEDVPPLTCNDRIKLANRYLSQNKFDAAQNVSRSRQSECSEQLAATRVKIFDQYQQRYCDIHVTRAKAYLSTKNYKKAINEIVGLSPESDCKDDIEMVVKQIKTDYQQDYTENFQAYVKVLELSVIDQQARLRLLELLQIKQLSIDND